MVALTLYNQNYCKKKISKKEILVPVCERSCWWSSSFELIIVVLVRRIRFTLVIFPFLLLLSLLMDPLRILAWILGFSSFSFSNGFVTLMLASPSMVFYLSS
jgi:hypothetical protein